MDFYVYIYCDPRKDLDSEIITCKKAPFYIGKGKDQRAYDHLHDNRTNKFKFRKIQSIRKNNLEPIIEIYKSNLSEQEAFNVETELILKFGRIGYEENGLLTNRTIGGGGISGYKHNQESIEKIRFAAKNRKLSQESKEKISKIHKGRTKSEDHLNNIAKNWIIKHNKIGIISIKNLSSFCKENNINFSSLKNTLRTGKPISRGASEGWQIISSSR